jgi:hypothetical protein
MSECLAVSFQGIMRCAASGIHLSRHGSAVPPLLPESPRAHRQRVGERRRFPKDGRGGDGQAAYAVTAWLQRADRNGSLESFFNPLLTPEERGVAAIEGWILGVV